jgi:hypothetical protein
MATSISRLWNTDENYWLLHPQMKTIKEFKDVFLTDKSKDKINSSKLMWAIALYCDPHDQNPWRNINDADRRTLIAEDFLLSPKFDWERSDIKELIEKYEDLCLTVWEKELVRLERKLSERSDFISSTKYTLDEYEENNGKVKLKKGTATQLDKMMTDTIKIYEQADKIKQMLGKESGGHTRGGAKESAGEKAEI